MGEARLTFLTTLRAGLRGAPPAAIDDAIGDYASHFEVGAAKGRTEEDIAAALGDPLALADELRVEMRIETWERKRSPGAAAKVVAGIIGLGLANALLVFVALPLVCIFVFLAAAIILGTGVAGVWLIFAGVSLGIDLALSLLAGAGLIFAAIALGALLALLLFALVGGLARYARLHYRLLPRTGQSRSGQPSKDTR